MKLYSNQYGNTEFNFEVVPNRFRFRYSRDFSREYYAHWWMQHGMFLISLFIMNRKYHLSKEKLRNLPPEIRRTHLSTIWSVCGKSTTDPKLNDLILNNVEWHIKVISCFPLWNPTSYSLSTYVKIILWFSMQRKKNDEPSKNR